MACATLNPSLYMQLFADDIAIISLNIASYIATSFNTGSFSYYGFLSFRNDKGDGDKVSWYFNGVWTSCYIVYVIRHCTDDN